MSNEKYIQKSLLWDITRRCNLNCLHCYNSGDTAHKCELNIMHNYEEIINRISDLGINHIHLLGGEPLLANGLFDLLDYARKQKILVSINSNGTLIDRLTIKKLIEADVHQLTISLDGATELDNDFIRGSGNYEVVINNLKDIAICVEKEKSSMIIQVATVITNKNYKEIHKLPRILKGLHIRYLDILKLYECGNAAREECTLKIDDEEYLKTLKKIIVESYRNGIYVQLDCKPKVLDLLNSKYGFNINCTNTSFYGCGAGEKILFMDYKGDIFPCGPFSHEKENTELSVNLFDKEYKDSVVNIQKHVKNLIEQFTIPYGKVCDSCEYNRFCTGCAICHKDYDKLCVVAERLYS